VVTVANTDVAKLAEDFDRDEYICGILNDCQPKISISEVKEYEKEVHDACFEDEDEKDGFSDEIHKIGGFLVGKDPIEKVKKANAKLDKAMSDIIKETNFSQGTIYRYYSNVGEIFLDYVNANTPENVLEQKIDYIIASMEEPEKILHDCIISIGEYIIEFVRTISGKTCCQMISAYGYDTKSYNNIILKMKYKQSLGYAQNELMKFLNKQSYLSCAFTLDSIAGLICSSIDGIASNTAIIATNTDSIPENTKVQFEILASMAIHTILGK
jgi:hypothetical protein